MPNAIRPRTAQTKKDTAPPLGEVLEFMRLLWAVDHGLQSMSKRMEGSIGVTGPQRLVIRLVARRPGISAGELAVLLHVHPSTLTGILRRLEDRAVLARRADPADKRRALLALTAKGMRLDGLRTGTVEQRVKAALGDQPAPRLRAARDVLASIATELALPSPAPRARFRLPAGRA